MDEFLFCQLERERNFWGNASFTYNKLYSEPFVVLIIL